LRTTIVPAQITTIEDKIAGNLGVSQLLLLVTPLFGGAALFAVLPPFFGSAPYKLVICVVLATVCATLAIRFKGRILLLWAIAILRYRLRPRYYVFDKRDQYLRDVEAGERELEPAEDESMEVAPQRFLPAVSAQDMVFFERLGESGVNVHFKTNRKGELSVHVTETK